MEQVVALRKESVDRNLFRHIVQCLPYASLSARRAWIEIIKEKYKDADMLLSLSARRAWIEIHFGMDNRTHEGSLSARRAWIEIKYKSDLSLAEAVALRKESVDRNCRSALLHCNLCPSLSARRAWIEIKSGLHPLMASLSRSPQGERG